MSLQASWLKTTETAAYLKTWLMDCH